jgi:hypothetical protein
MRASPIKSKVTNEKVKGLNESKIERVGSNSTEREGCCKVLELVIAFRLSNRQESGYTDAHKFKTNSASRAGGKLN